MNIVILTGAGISAESGLGTFRDTDGLWTKYDLKDVATPDGFARDPDLVHGFYNARRANCLGATPNPAHVALAKLTALYAGEVLIVTQNVDDLHERAGVPGVIHMHGQLSRAVCAACGHRWDSRLVMASGDACPSCAARATRPDVVWFGEMPYHMDLIEARLRACDLFVSIGTSGTVYPAAGFVQMAAQNGADTLELNLEPSGGARGFRTCRLGEAGTIVPAWVAEVLEQT